jgi:hypothetical protein
MTEPPQRPLLLASSSVLRARIQPRHEAQGLSLNRFIRGPKARSTPAWGIAQENAHTEDEALKARFRLSRSLALHPCEKMRAALARQAAASSNLLHRSRHCGRQSRKRRRQPHANILHRSNRSQRHQRRHQRIFNQILARLVATKRRRTNQKPRHILLQPTCKLHKAPLGNRSACPKVSPTRKPYSNPLFVVATLPACASCIWVDGSTKISLFLYLKEPA